MKAVITALLLFAAAAPAAAAKWVVDPARSRIAFTATWLGNKVPGSFRRWTAAIDFDPAAPAKAAVTVDVDLASVVTGDKTVDGSLPGDDWFAIGSGRQGRFVATKVTATGPGRYVAAGTLKIRGRAVPVTLPFTLAVKGDIATMTGTTQLDRRAWKIGVESDATADYVSFPVALTVNVIARRGR